MEIGLNFFPFHIGDYAAHARNLSLMEDIAYRRLLDAYYLAERPLSGSSTDVAREIGMRDQLDSVEYVLGKFFTRCEDAWINKRADQEIAKYNDKKQKASDAGKASAKRRVNAGSTDVKKTSTSVEKIQTDVQLTKNQEPRTNTPPTPKGGGKRFEEFWTAWPKNDRKQDKVKCARKWKSESLDDLADRILSDIAIKEKTEKWRGGFVEAPLVYLNGRRWEDGVEASSQAGIPDHMAGAI